MTATEIRKWILERYGPITLDYAQGVYVAVVPLHTGVAIGMGSRRANSICDLYRNLSAGKREPPLGIAMLAWEKVRFRKNPSSQTIKE